MGVNSLLNMRVNFKITETTTLNPIVLMERTRSLVIEKKYIIESNSEHIILFKYNPWRFGSTAEIFRNVDGGKFEIVNTSGQSSLEFTYYVSILIDVMIISLLTVLGFFVEPFTFLGAFAVFSQMIFRISEIKKVSRRFLSSIIA